jgi:hypothetical protein
MPKWKGAYKAELLTGSEMTGKGPRIILTVKGRKRKGRHAEP